MILPNFVSFDEAYIISMIYIITVVIRAQQTTVTDKVKNRLEQLDDFEEVRGQILIYLLLQKQ